MRIAFVLVGIAALFAASAAIDALQPLPTEGPPAADVRVVTHAAPETGNDLPAMAEPALVPEQPAATPFSQVLPQAQAPQSARAPQPRGGTSLPLPDGVSVVWGGCASDGECHWYNFYWAPMHEVVMQASEAPVKVQHELCHAHQHWSINRGAALDPRNFDLHSWYATPEGRSFTEAAAGLPWPWENSAVNAIEDFAWTCAYWYLDPGHLLTASPHRYDWAAANLP